MSLGDDVTEGITKSLRLRVLLDARKPLKDKILLKMRGGVKEQVTVRYEKLPLFCYCCGMLGHGEKVCDENVGEVTAQRRLSDVVRVASQWKVQGLASEGEKGGNEETLSVGTVRSVVCDEGLNMPILPALEAALQGGVFHLGDVEGSGPGSFVVGAKGSNTKSKEVGKLMRKLKKVTIRHNEDAAMIGDVSNYTRLGEKRKEGEGEEGDMMSEGNHAPILLQERDEIRRRGRKKRFHFEALWLAKPECHMVIKKAWEESAGLMMEDRIEGCVSNLRVWARKSFGDIRKKIGEKEKELGEWQCCEPDVAMLNACKKIVAELDELHRLDETFWHARARANELKDGDKNTSYFQHKASQRKQRNRIDSLENSDGVVRDNDDEIQEVI
uniref:Zinc knuckle CX2CX4HX4C domain-containing protein n=1 Tax=Chenopodium quinoa TaxID=63459 RepID=A0A803LA15_CHEQI